VFIIGARRGFPDSTLAFMADTDKESFERPFNVACTTSECTPSGACCGSFGCVETLQAECDIAGKFRGNGTTCATQSNCPSIPAVSEWGLIALTMLMLVAGTVVLRRRTAAV